MLKSKFNRHIFSFLTIALASILLYPAVQAGLTLVTLPLLGLALLAAVLTLTTK